MITVENSLAEQFEDEKSRFAAFAQLVVEQQVPGTFLKLRVVAVPVVEDESTESKEQEKGPHANQLDAITVFFISRTLMKNQCQDAQKDN
jgi:hypothetical protein